MTNGKEHIDLELITRLKKGDIHAFDKIYELYAHKLHSFISRMLKNETEADDIVQEVFVKIWESKHHLDNHKLLNSYLFTIAYNRSIDLIRKRINNQKYIEYLKKSSIWEEVPDSLSELECKDFLFQVDQLIASLPERQKQVYLLHKEQGLTYPEIADRLSISKNTVENHMVKALSSLRKKMSHPAMSNMLIVSLFLIDH